MTHRERVQQARKAVAQRNRNLSPRRRKAIARRAALARWAKASSPRRMSPRT